MAILNIEGEEVPVGEGAVTRPAVEAAQTITPAEALTSNVVLGAGSGSNLEAKAEGNTAVGTGALKHVTTGIDNTAVGFNAGESLKTGKENTAVGWSALGQSQAGEGNVAVGLAAAAHLTSGAQNIAVGYEALQSGAVTGEGNIAIGVKAADALTSGNNNIAVGHLALSGNKVGENNVVLGPGAGAAALGSSNIFLGFEAGNAETGSNQLYIANNGTTALLRGVMSATEASQELGFFGTAPHTKPEVTGSTVTTKELAEALALIGLVKVN